MFYENLRPDSNKDDSPDDLRFTSEDMPEFFSDIYSEKAKNCCHDTDKSYCENDIDWKECKRNTDSESIDTRSNTECHERTK